MSRRRPRVAPRIPVFLGCEGESEQSYGQLLNGFLREAGHPFHLDAVTLNPGAGDPLSRIRRAEQEIARRQQRRAEFRLKVILMDFDQVESDRNRQELAERLARELDITIIWQIPCHEAVLLRHLQGFSQHRPATTGDAEAALRRAWPQYRKPMTRHQLSEQIGLNAISRAAAVEPSLADFLRRIALLP